MIFVTVGTQLPFDRLVKTVDNIADKTEEQILGQTGKSASYATRFEATEFLSPEVFNQCINDARIIIGHAGIGTVLSGLRAQKTLLLMARKASLGEHRNDHQLATAAQVKKIPGIYIIENEEEILALLKRPDLDVMSEKISPMQDALIGFLRDEISRLK